MVLFSKSSFVIANIAINIVPLPLNRYLYKLSFTIIWVLCNVSSLAACCFSLTLKFPQGCSVEVQICYFKCRHTGSTNGRNRDQRSLDAHIVHNQLHNQIESNTVAMCMQCNALFLFAAYVAGIHHKSKLTSRALWKTLTRLAFLYAFDRSGHIWSALHWSSTCPLRIINRRSWRLNVSWFVSFRKIAQYTKLIIFSLTHLTAALNMVSKYRYKNTNPKNIET